VAQLADAAQRNIVVGSGELRGLALADGPATTVHSLPTIPAIDQNDELVIPLRKRVFDVVVALAMLVVLLPVLLLTALAIKLEGGGAVLYRQRRTGYRNQPFLMLKFRSMVDGAERALIDLRDSNITDGLLFKCERDPRVTTVGRFIRRLSIDELPQLWNVVRGDMSLVGPRPLPVEPESFAADEARRHWALPGITGSWQVAGGPRLTYREMIELDLEYLRDWSLRRDLGVLLRTVPAVIQRGDL
jgi:lipopolysaccharide/colanic/teichoic acid biosynthesis glycosyltransferase